MYLKAGVVVFVCLNDFSNGFYNCSDGVVYVYFFSLILFHDFCKMVILHFATVLKYNFTFLEHELILESHVIFYVVWLFKFISDYLPYFGKINIFFNIITKKFELIYKNWSKLFVRFIRNNLNQAVHTLGLLTRCVQPDCGYFFMNQQKLRSILKWCLNQFKGNMCAIYSKHVFNCE